MKKQTLEHVFESDGDRTWLCLSPILLNRSMKINSIDYSLCHTWKPNQLKFGSELKQGKAT